MMRDWWYVNWPDLAAFVVAMQAVRLAAERELRIISWRFAAVVVVLQVAFWFQRVYARRSLERDGEI